MMRCDDHLVGYQVTLSQLSFHYSLNHLGYYTYIISN